MQQGALRERHEEKEDTNNVRPINILKHSAAIGLPLQRISPLEFVPGRGGPQF